MLITCVAALLLGLGYIVTESSIKLTPYNYANFVVFIIGVACLSGGAYMLATHPHP